MGYAHVLFSLFGLAVIYDEPWNEYVPPPDTCNTGTQTEAIEAQNSMLKGMLYVCM